MNRRFGFWKLAAGFGLASKCALFQRSCCLRRRRSRLAGIAAAVIID